MFKPFSFKQAEARDFLKNSKAILRSAGLKLVTERSTQTKSLESFKQNPPQLLIVVPRRVGNACTRNRIRRRIKSAFYQLELFQKISGKYALFVYPEAASFSYKEIEGFLSALTPRKPSENN
ncbi:ribonuclease P protein component [Candidatus Dependentiae bacterium]|nr:ribonuclease P protein component [Candidatus Dependentiae bacterium]